MTARPTVLYEDNHLLGVFKPAGWIVQGAGEGDDSLLTWGKDDLKRRHGKPGNVFLAAVSRLDRPVTGVVLLAKTSKAAARLNEQIRERNVDKIYTALISPPPGQEEAIVYSQLSRDDQRGKTDVMKQLRAEQFDSQNPAHAALRYRLERRAGDIAQVTIELLTGRKHQIRAQFAAMGSSIVGDRKYGGRDLLGIEGIALHCLRFTCLHPTRHEPVTLTAAPPWRWPSRS